MLFYIFVLIPKERVVAWCLLYIICLCVAVFLYILGGYTLVAEDDKTFNDVVQFANISCPRACGEHIYGLVVDTFCGDVVARAYLFNKILY